jgi:NAD(P)-dependent dehydrogenase (short-subunit alcohol dehydrogenase family)
MSEAHKRRSIVVTGGNTGLGFQCARFIGAEDPDAMVVLGCRDVRAGLLARIKLMKLGVSVAVLPLDLASLESVRNFVTLFHASRSPPLASLVCNAAVLNVRAPERTVDGFETTFAVNHLGHFLLANLLLPDLVENGRVTFVSSGSHDPAEKTGLPAPRFESARQAAADFDPAGHAARRRYTTSKLCNVYCAYEMARRLERAADPRLRSIRVNAFDPGMMPGTRLARTYPAPARFMWNFVLPVLARSKRNVHHPATSGQRLAKLATDFRDETTGRYFSDGRSIRSSAASYDAAKAHELWEQSAAMVGIDPVIAGTAMTGLDGAVGSAA